MIQEYDYGVRPVTNTGHATAGPAGNTGSLFTILCKRLSQK